MQNQAAMAYQQVARKTTNPRDLEADLLSRAAYRLSDIKDNWPAGRNELNDALMYNQKIWHVLILSVTKEENPLPTMIKQNVANLGIFVFNETRELIEANHKIEKINALISINQELSAGLRASQAATT